MIVNKSYGSAMEGQPRTVVRNPPNNVFKGDANSMPTMSRPVLYSAQHFLYKEYKELN